MVTVIQHGIGERDAPRAVLLYPVPHDPALLFFESLGTRKQRSSVAVRTDAQQDEIESREFARRGTEEFAQVVLIEVRRLFGVGQLTVHAGEVFRRTWKLGQQRLFRHPKVALRKIRRDVALVSPEEENLVPWQP